MTFGRVIRSGSKVALRWFRGGLEVATRHSRNSSEVEASSSRGATCTKINVRRSFPIDHSDAQVNDRAYASVVIDLS
ncbi:hypothetical protein B296_00008352 [Ensete ventricosum]|uniref:Uncharacterized protein n=1 Tax=Ensete ventricosum TaxID=4639 RepID=A0A427AP13_ENSVE|nr:hypothetical protein B296_00008352 [Ensete ventricosum]